MAEEVNHGSSRTELSRVRLGTPLLVNFDQMGQPIKAALIGLEVDQYLILRFPRFSWLSDLLFEGNAVTVKFTSRGKVFAFQSALVGRFLKNNLSLILIHYPEDLEMYDARNYPRIQCFVPAETIIGKNVCSSLVLDVSAGGCLLGLVDPPDDLEVKPDGQISVVASVLGMEGKQTFEGVVTSVRRRDQALELGVRFNDPDPDLIKSLEDYINDVNRKMNRLGLR